MRKFIFNSSVIGAVIGLVSTVQATRSGWKDWRVPLMWISSGISVAIAVGTVIEDSQKAAERSEQH